MATQTGECEDWDRLITEYDRLVAQVLAMRQKIMRLRPSARVTRCIHPSKLVDVLATRFDEEEQRYLCFHLGVDYEDLPAKGKAGKAIELVEYLGRRNRISELIEIIEQMRSDVSWDGAPEVTQGTAPTCQRNLWKS
jgi:hypothetical protein